MQPSKEVPKKTKYLNPGSCLVVGTLALISGKWKLVVFWCIINDLNRFGLISKEVPDISKRMLTKVLRELEADGLIQRKVFAEVPPRVEYSLTPKGDSFMPVMNELRKWGEENLK